MAKRMTIMVIILAIVVGGIVWFFAFFKPKMINNFFAHMTLPPATVATAEAKQAEWQSLRTAIGTIAATQQITVTTEVAGKVQKISFHSGDPVKQSSVLVQLDTDVDKADLKGFEASAELARANFKRDQKLLARRATSTTDFETTQAQLRNAEAKVESQKAVISKKTITAPFNGTLGIRQVSLGEYLQPGTPIVSLQALDKVYVNFNLPEQDFSAVKTGQTVNVSVPAFPGRIFSGTVTAVDARVDENTRNFTVQGTFENPDHALRPGMFADVSLITGAPMAVVTVPESAIDAKLYGTSVFVVTDTGKKDAQGKPELTVERQYVETGDTRAHEVRITKGLKAGTTVVTAGQLKLQNGSHVVINNDVQLQ